MRTWMYPLLVVLANASPAPVQPNPEPSVHQPPPPEAQYAGPCFFERVVRVGSPDGPPFKLYVCADGAVLLRPDVWTEGD